MTHTLNTPVRIHLPGQPLHNRTGRINTIGQGGYLNSRTEYVVELDEPVVINGTELTHTMPLVKSRLKPIKAQALPAKSQTIYRYIIRYKSQHDGNSPSIREIGAYMGGASTSVVNGHLAKLERSRLIVRPLNGKTRGIEVVGGKWVAPGGTS